MYAKRFAKCDSHFRSDRHFYFHARAHEYANDNAKTY